MLTLTQIRNLHTRYTAVVNFINTQNEGQPNGLRIKQVQLPSSMTQSLVYYFIVNYPNHIGLENIIVGNLAEGNNRTYDLIYQTGIHPINIEVKATGTNDFQRFRPHALTANFVFWLNFRGALYDIAIFNPNILTPRNNGEVDITWRNLTILQNVEIIRDIRIE
ncbi:MAG: hypothetical protein ACOYOV_05515 [Bacteroidales bacterium]